MGRKWSWRILAALSSLALVWGGYRAATGWWFDAELGQAFKDVVAGRFDSARDRLILLSEFRPGVAEVQYHLGVCEQATGHPDRAWAAWSSIEPGSPFAAMAARGRDRLLR